MQKGKGIVQSQQAQAASKGGSCCTTLLRSGQGVALGTEVLVSTSCHLEPNMRFALIRFTNSLRLAAFEVTSRSLLGVMAVTFANHNPCSSAGIVTIL
jgi:hypothetical protein